MLDSTSATVTKDKPFLTDAEAVENKSAENEALTNADVDNESVSSEDDSDSSDDSSMPDEDKKVKKEKGSKKGKQKGKGKGKGKVYRNTHFLFGNVEEIFLQCAHFIFGVPRFILNISFI